jgi:hypothetical protein
MIPLITLLEVSVSAVHKLLIIGFLQSRTLHMYIYNILLILFFCLVVAFYKISKGIFLYYYTKYILFIYDREFEGNL